MVIFVFLVLSLHSVFVCFSLSFSPSFCLLFLRNIFATILKQTQFSLGADTGDISLGPWFIPLFYIAPFNQAKLTLPCPFIQQRKVHAGVQSKSYPNRLLSLFERHVVFFWPKLNHSLKLLTCQQICSMSLSFSFCLFCLR